MKRLLLAVFVSCIMANLSLAAEKSYPRGELLLEPNKLAQALDKQGYVILDVRSEEAYAEGHIPQSRRIDHDQWKSAFADPTEAAPWSERIANLGIDRDSQVVVYDDNKSKEAARVWWLLRYWGVEHAQLLNGGWKAWTAAELPTSTDTPEPAKATEFQATPHEARLATKSSVLDLLASKSLQMVDSRSYGEFCGTAPGKNQRGGAIPGAKHLEWSDLIDPETDRFKSAAELSALFEKAGIDVRKPVATHCQSGGRASVMAFGLELMGGEQVSNYYQGWSEWGNDPNTPIETPQPEPAAKP